MSIPRTFARAVAIAVALVLALAAITLAQGDEIPGVPDPTVAMLGTTAGIAGIVWIFTQLVRPAVSAAVFDTWGPVFAVLVGIALAELYVLVTVSPVTGQSLLQGFLVGTVGGFVSQNVNKVLAPIVSAVRSNPNT